MSRKLAISLVLLQSLLLLIIATIARLTVFFSQPFTGDIPVKIEETVVARGTPVAADILKIPHHGSDTSTGDELHTAVQPSDTIISVGDNSHGHPADRVLFLMPLTIDEFRLQWKDTSVHWYIGTRTI